MRAYLVSSLLLMLALSTSACNLRQASDEKNETIESLQDVAASDLSGRPAPKPQVQSPAPESTPAQNDKFVHFGEHIVIDGAGPSVASHTPSAAPPQETKSPVGPSVAPESPTLAPPSSIVAMMEQDDLIEPTAPSPEQQAAADARARLPKVASLQVGEQRDPGTHAVTKPSLEMSTSAPAIYVAANITGLHPAATITGTLTAVDVVLDKQRDLKVSYYEMASKDLTAPGEETAAAFSFAPPTRGWPAGTYAVTLSVNGVKMQSVTFAMKGALQ